MKNRLLKSTSFVLIVICAFFAFTSKIKAGRAGDGCILTGYSTGISSSGSVSYINGTDKLTLKLKASTIDRGNVRLYPINIILDSSTLFSNMKDGVYGDVLENDGQSILNYKKNNNKCPEVLIYKKYSNGNLSGKFNIYNDYDDYNLGKKTDFKISTTKGQSGVTINEDSKLIFFNDDIKNMDVGLDKDFLNIIKAIKIESNSNFLSCKKNTDDLSHFCFNEGIDISYEAGIDLWKNKIDKGLTSEEKKVLQSWFSQIFYIPASEFFNPNVYSTNLLTKGLNNDIIKEYNKKYASDKNAAIQYIIDNISISSYEKYNFFKLLKASTDDTTYKTIVAQIAVEIYNKTNGLDARISEIEGDLDTYFEERTNEYIENLYSSYCEEKTKNQPSTAQEYNKKQCKTDCNKKLTEVFTDFNTCKVNALKTANATVSDSSVNMLKSSSSGFEKCLSTTASKALSLTSEGLCKTSAADIEKANEYSSQSSYSQLIDEQNELEDALTNTNILFKKQIEKFKAEIETKKVNDLNIECDEVKAFRGLWLLIIIAAPFLLIIFGSIDYFKVMIASDIDGMNKFKKNFRTRVIAFLLLILTPFIVRTIVGFVGAGNDSKTVKLMYCIVVGGD